VASSPPPPTAESLTLEVPENETEVPPAHVASIRGSRTYPVVAIFSATWESDVEPDTPVSTPVPPPRESTEATQAVVKQDNSDGIITLSSDEEDNHIRLKPLNPHLTEQLKLAQSVIAQQQKQIKKLHTEKSQLLRQASYRAGSINDCGAHADLPPSPQEVRKRRKFVASGAWPPSLHNAPEMSNHELSGRLVEYYDNWLTQ